MYERKDRVVIFLYSFIDLLSRYLNQSIKVYDVLQKIFAWPHAIPECNNNLIYYNNYLLRGGVEGIHNKSEVALV